MTFMHQVDPYFPETYLMCENELPASRFLKVIIWQTDTTEIIYIAPLRRWSIIIVCQTVRVVEWSCTLHVNVFMLTEWWRKKRRVGWRSTNGKCFLLYYKTLWWAQRAWRASNCHIVLSPPSYSSCIWSPRPHFFFFPGVFSRFVGWHGCPVCWLYRVMCWLISRTDQEDLRRSHHDMQIEVS